MIKKILVGIFFISIFFSSAHARLGGEVGNGGIYVSGVPPQPPSTTSK